MIFRCDHAQRSDVRPSYRGRLWICLFVTGFSVGPGQNPRLQAVWSSSCGSMVLLAMSAVLRAIDISVLVTTICLTGVDSSGVRSLLLEADLLWCWCHRF